MTESAKHIANLTRNLLFLRSLLYAPNPVIKKVEDDYKKMIEKREEGSEECLN